MHTITNDRWRVILHEVYDLYDDGADVEVIVEHVRNRLEVEIDG